VTHEHLMGQENLRSRRDRTGEAEIMGGPPILAGKDSVRAPRVRGPGHDDS
jgi:hypothetical protein